LTAFRYADGKTLKGIGTWAVSACHFILSIATAVAIAMAARRAYSCFKIQFAGVGSLFLKPFEPFENRSKGIKNNFLAPLEG
jgi:hypothetical protein